MTMPPDDGPDGGYGGSVEAAGAEPAAPADGALDAETRLVEAVLILEPEPVSRGRISGVTGLDVEVVGRCLARLQAQYDRHEHGIRLRELGGTFVLGPAGTCWEVLKPSYAKKHEQRLSRAALETLAIVAYSQPVTRGEIESIRGVSADAMIRQLLDKGLIREIGRRDAPGRPSQYGTTRDFLRIFGLSSIADLPKLNELDSAKFDSDG